MSPPKAENWFLVRNDEGVSFVKRMDPQKFDQKVHTFAATAVLDRLPQKPATGEEFLELRKKRNVAEGRRFKVLKHEEVLIVRPDTFCSRYSITTEDFGAPFSSRLIIEARGIGCAHPDERDVVVDVGISERSPNGGFTASFSSEGEEIINSLRFGPVTAWDQAAMAVKAVEDGRDSAPLDELRRYAELGYPVAQSLWGRVLAYGRAQQKPDRLQAVSWIRRAVEQGHPVAQNNLGICFLQGIGVPINYSEARDWFRRSSQQGYKEADRVLAELEKMIALRSSNQAADREAFRQFRESAEKGDAKAQFELAAMYEDGRGVASNMQEAIIWYRKSAENGFSQAAYYIGAIYDFGRGLPQDDGEAVKWYVRAAENGVAQAQYNLFVMYRSGRGVAPDESQSRVWLRKAASSGHPGARSWMRQLGER